VNRTLRHTIVAGLGALALTEKAARRRVDDLVARGDISRKEGERILVQLERRWKEESHRLVEQGDKTVAKLEKVLTTALSTALDRAGLARKAEVDELRRQVERLAARPRRRAPRASAQGGRRERARQDPGPDQGGPA
jgi:poly(hydroxyalkanoate) granule-associated protein